MNNKFNLKLIKNVLSVLPVLFFVYLFFNTILIQDHGLDITDESFYLLSAQFPSESIASVTQFGYYTGLLNAIVGDNIFYFRSIGLLLLLVISTTFAIMQEFVFVKIYRFKNDFLVVTGRVFTVLLGALCYYYVQLSTPSYNWLSLVACLLAYCGLLLSLGTCSSPAPPQSFLGFLFILGGIIFGIGVGLAFMAKPTTAILLALVGLVGAVLTRSRGSALRFTVVFAISALFFLCFHIFYFEGGVSEFFYKILNGLTLHHLLGDKHDFSSIITRGIADLESIPFRIYHLLNIGWMILPVTVFIIWNIPERFREITKELSITLILVLIWWGGLEADHWTGGAIFSNNLGLAGIVLLSMAIVSVLINCIRDIDNLKVCKSYYPNNVIIPLLISLGAFVYGFGTNNSLVDQASDGFVFFVSGSLGIMILFEKMRPQSIMPQIFCSLISISMLLVFQGAIRNQSYFPAPISDQTQRVSVGRAGTSIYVDTKTREYIVGLKEIATSSGWVEDTPLIDLTGESPGASFILGARPPGTPWLFGGLPGSKVFAAKILGHVRKDILDRAWVLTSPTGNRKIPMAILKNVNIQFPENYKYIGEVKNPLGEEIQKLYKPLFAHQQTSL